MRSPRSSGWTAISPAETFEAEIAGARDHVVRAVHGLQGEEGYRINIQGVDDGLLYEAFAQIARRAGGIALVHAENQELAALAAELVRAEGCDDLGAFADSWPCLVEAQAVQRDPRAEGWFDLGRTAGVSGDRHDPAGDAR